jgi:2-oxoglutarate dehydrogenase E2 component (dihydrolipoamide succinyltransferase)
MNKHVEIQLPKLGESILSAKVLQWLKKEGDFVEENEPLVEVTTDKVNSEIPSICKGILKKILAPADQEVEIGQVLAVIESSKENNLDVSQITKPHSAEEPTAYISPAVLKLMQDHHMSYQEITAIAGSGERGRVTKRDVENYLALRSSKAACSRQSASMEEEKIQMSPMRKTIAENMRKSVDEAPHATLIMEADVTQIVQTIASKKEQFLKEHGVKLTITSYIAMAIAKGLKKYPYLNASIQQDSILLKKSINMGIAVSLDGGVIVPVIQHIDQMDLTAVAKAIAKVSYQAKHNQISLDATQGGTITMTNFGMAGAIIGIPIIRFPEVAIIGVGALTKKCTVVDEDRIAIRSMVYLSLTFDHRVVDGMYGSEFLAYIKKNLELNDIIN